MHGSRYSSKGLLIGFSGGKRPYSLDNAEPFPTGVYSVLNSYTLFSPNQNYVVHFLSLTLALRFPGVYGKKESYHCTANQAIYSGSTL